MAKTEAIDPGPDLVGLQQYWKKVLEKRIPAYRKYWGRAEQVVQRYEDRRDTAGDAFRYKGGVNAGRRYNILWSNTETMMPLLFNKVPQPVVRRRWGDDRPVARTAAEMLERASTFNLDRKDVYFVDNMKSTVHNMLVPGTGVLWARYDPKIQVGPLGLEVGDETVYFDYVHWRDFLAGKANTWSQVPWIARKLWMKPREVSQRWGPKAQVWCQPERKKGEENSPGDHEECCIYEIWDYKARMVVFVSLDAPEALEATEDPLRLTCFYPCPKPLRGVWNTSDVIPMPIYCQYQDQAMELDTVTGQIYNMLRACKVAGVYNGSMGADFQQMLQGNENKMVPIDDWQDFSVTGGVVGNTAFMPLNDVVQALNALYQAREAIKADLNEITGMPDIFRGQSSPLDAEGTNDLKVQWGASRVRDDQREVQQFCADLISIQAEIMAEHFTPDSLMAMSGMKIPTAQEQEQVRQGIMQLEKTEQEVPPELVEVVEGPTLEQVMGLLRADKLRGFSLDVESDSTVESDDAKERSSRAEFMDVLTGMIERWGPIVREVPLMLPLVKELMLFAIAPFRAGRQFEEEVERTFTMLERQAKQAAEAPPPPDPLDKAAHAELQKTAMQEQGDTQREAMQQAGQDRRKLLDIAADKEAREVDAVVELAKGAMQ